MGFLGNVKNVLFGAAYEEDYDDDYAVEGTVQDSTPAAAVQNETEKNATKSFARAVSGDHAAEPKRDRSKVVNLHESMKLSVVLVKPERYEEVAEIANHLRDKRTIVLNLEKANREIARRILDFLSGVAYTIDGNLKMIATNTYIITPYNVDIQGELIDELESSGLYI